jgi:hypothetical protein
LRSIFRDPPGIGSQTNATPLHDDIELAHCA